MTNPARSGGYSLLELLTVLALVLGLQVLVWPSMSDALLAMRLRSSAEAMLSGLNMSRAAAVQHNARVSMCKSQGGSACTPGAGWSQGWVIFHDSNANGSLDAGETVLMRQEPLSGAITIRANGPVDHFVSYTPLGQAQLLNGGFQAGTFLVCASEAARSGGYQVVVAPSGRARMAKAAMGQCP